MTAVASPGVQPALPVLAVLGPTAAGKTALAMEAVRRRRAAGRQPTEVVAVDAFTLYRGMDVATAKPSAAERDEVPHHLVDVLEVEEDVTVAWFRDQARRIVDELHAAGTVPLLVGGAGLYWRATVDPLDLPPTDPAVRARVEARWAGRPAAAHAHLAGVDGAAAARIDADNLRRTVRALEVLELTGRPFSSFRTDWDDYRSRHEDLRVAYVEPPTAVLRPRIDDRARSMVAGGLLEEAATLRRRNLSRTARQAIGYAEAFAALDARAAGEAIDPDALAARIATRTWQYARRQRTWFRKDPRCVGVDTETAIAMLAAAP